MIDAMLEEVVDLDEVVSEGSAAPAGRRLGRGQSAGNPPATPSTTDSAGR